MSEKILFFGTPQIATHTLKELNKHFEVVLVVTEPDKPAGRGLKVQPTPVKKVALKLGLPVAQPTNKKELTELLQAQSADLGAIIAYGQILTAEAIASLPQGILNIHGSLLPKYRGPSPIQYAILHGDQKTGVTIMKIDAGVDTGDILAKKEVIISPTDTTPTLAQKLVGVGTELLIETIPLYLAGKIKPQPQTGQVTHAPKISKEMGEIDWSKNPQQIVREIRAFNGWPKSFTTFNGQRLIIHEAKVVAGQLKPLVVQLAGKQKVSWSDFLNGQRLSEKEALETLQSKKT